MTFPLDELGFPVVPTAPKDPTGQHWGMKHGIGWSNPIDCPDRAILWHVLARADRAAITEAINHYGLPLVRAYWSAMKENGPIKDKRSFFSTNNGDLMRSTIPKVDAILSEVAGQRD